MALRVINQAVLIDSSEYSYEMETFDEMIKRALAILKLNGNKYFEKEIDEDFGKSYKDSLYREIEIDDELCVELEMHKINNESFCMTLYRVLRELALVVVEDNGRYDSEHSNCSVEDCGCKIIQWPTN